jgi:glucose 1-dehydrogenase
MTLAGKVALVTGSAQGIGRAIALRLAREGADIIVDDRMDDSRAEETLAEVRAAGRKGHVVSGDIGNSADDRRIVEDGIAALGGIDILVNNAGVEVRSPFLAATEADYDLVLGVNLRGVYFTTQSFARHLADRKKPGRIINVSSVHEELPFPNFTSYCASKGGLKMLMRNLAIELAPLGITVNNVAPGAVATPINTRLLQTPALLQSLMQNIPLGRLGTPDDVAGLVAFLASNDASYITGTTLYVDGGLLWNYSEQ